jgi:hypothetical protein
MDARNYNYDFELTKGDINRIDRGKITPEIEAKLQRDLERLDNDPIYAPVNDAEYVPQGRVEGDMWIDEAGNEEAIPFSKAQEYEPDLIVQHNLSEDNLLHAEKMGGIPVPSLAIVKHDQPLKGFGEITLIGAKELADPKGYAKTVVHGADVYSPRYPKVAKQFVQKDEKAIIDDLTANMEALGRKGYDVDVEDLADNVALKMKFLQERGIEPSIIKESVPEKAMANYNALKDLIKEGDDSLDLYRNEAFRERVREMLGEDKIARWSDDQIARVYDGYARDVVMVRNRLSTPEKVDFSSTRQAISDQVNVMKAEFKKYVDEYMQSHNVQEKIFNGTDNNGRKKWLPHTIENVIKKMKQNLVGGESFNYGTGSLRAKYTPQFKTIKQIQEAKGRLVSKEDFAAVKEEVENELFAVRDALEGSYTYSAKGFQFTEAVQNMLDDAASMGLTRALKEHGWKDVPEDVIADAQGFMDRLRSMPTEYFEANIVRSVSPAEFHVAVVPDNIGSEALQKLKDHGIKVEFYKAGDEADRVRAIKEASQVNKEQLMFSKAAHEGSAVHTTDSMNETLAQSLGKELADKLSPIMSVINKSDIPEAVLAKNNGNPEGIHGYVYNGKAYIVADNIPQGWSEQQVRGLVMHEVGVHLRKVGDVEAFGRIKDRVKALANNDDRVKEAYAAVPKKTEAHLVDEEALGYLVQHYPEMGVVKQLIAWVRSALRKAGFTNESLAMNADDLVYMAWGAVKRGDSGVVSKEVMFHAKALIERYVDPKTNLLKLDLLIKDSATKLPEPIKSYSDFKSQFSYKDGQYYLETPYTVVKVDPEFAYSHLTKNTANVNRFEISGAFVDTFKDPLFVVRKDYKHYTRYPKNKSDKGEYTIEDSYVYYKAYEAGEDYHIAAFAIDKDGKFITAADGSLKPESIENSTFYRIEKYDIGKIKGMVEVPEKDMKYYKHSAQNKSEHYEQTKLSRSADSESVLQSGDDVKTWEKARDEWHQDSHPMTKNEDGTPKVFYHGTPTGGFDVFDIERTSDKSLMTKDGPGFNFTDNKEFAQNYLTNVNKTNSTGKKELYETYLNLKKPIVITDRSANINLEDAKALFASGDYPWFFDSWIPFELDKRTINGKQWTKAEIESLSKEEKVSLYVDNITQRGEYDQGLLENIVRAFKNKQHMYDSMREHLKADGVIWQSPRGNVAVAWSPEQIKSIHNRGTFDESDANILFSRTETPQESAGGFRSAAAAAIDKMPPKMEAAAFINYLKKAGVKDDEIRWSGIEDAIEGKASITKVEAEAALSHPVLEKKVSGSSGDVAQMQADSNKLLELHEQSFNSVGENNPYKKPHDEFDQNELIAFEKYVKEKYGVDTVSELDRLIAQKSGVKYEQYSSKGVGGNYREELTTLDTPMQDGIKIIDGDDGYWYAEKAPYDGSVVVDSSGSKDHLMKKYSDGNQYKSSHWDEPNVLYHVRKQDTTINGDKTLLIEEIQSDWHQAGRKSGYKLGDEEQILKEKNQAVDDLDAEHYARLEELGIDKNSYEANQVWQKEFRPKLEAIREKYAEATKRIESGIPQAPYAKNWHEKALKDQIDEAVANGYDRVAWVDGKTSADRYSLAKQVSEIKYNQLSENDIRLNVSYKDGSTTNTMVDRNNLDDYVGKDMADKIRTDIYEKYNVENSYTGLDLEVGGEGMKGFYDKILPDYAKKYVKKYGSEVTKEKLPNGQEVWSFPVTNAMKEDVSQNGQALYAHGAGAVAGVGEDEEGNFTFDPTMALLGAAGVSMVASKTVRNAVSKLAAKAEKLSDAAARNLVVATIKGADKITAGSITKIAEAIGKSDIVDYVVGHKIYKMKDYMKMREEALRSSNAGMEHAARLHLQLKELSSEAREAMYEYMSGNTNVILSTELKRAADTFIDRIDTMGKAMVDEGFLSKEAYEEWKGQYLHRRYASKMKRASDWAAGKGEFAVDKIQMRGKQWRGDADEFDDLDAAGMIGKVSEGKVEAVQAADGSYQFRRDWTHDERTAMGEIRDVAYSLPETMGRLSQMIEFGKMLKGVPQKYLLEQGARSDKVMRDLGYEKLSASRYGALNGKWVNSSIANDLKRVSNDVMGEEANVQRLWNNYVTAVKMSHTVYNPTAHVNNIGSNVFLQAAAGLNPLKTLQYATEGTVSARRYGQWKVLDAKRVSGLNAEEAADLARLEADEGVQLWKQLDEKKMFGRSQLNEMLRTYMSPHIDTTSGSALHKTSESLKALYQGEDDVMRYAAVKQLMEDGLWSDTKSGVQQVKMDLDQAMKHVNDNIVPDYTKPMSKLALTLRDSGLVPFMSWTYYSTPILFKQLRDHPSRVLAIAAAWYGMDRLMGVDPYNDETMPKGFDAQRVAIARDGDKVTGMRVSSMIPHIQLAQPSNTFLEPLTSGIPQTILGSATNYNFYFRKPITQKEGGEGAYHRFTDTWQNVLPSPDVIDKAYNLGESHLLDKETRRRDRVFEPRTPAQEAASFFVNLRTYDVSQQRDRVRKDKIKAKKTDKKWEQKVDRAINKLEKVFQ